LNTIRWNDWKASFAVLKGNIGTATRDVTIAELLSGAGYRTGHFGNRYWLKVQWYS
jgi:arylsulfatase A-like enzyme